MKQYRWIAALVFALAALIAIFLIVDSKTKKKEERIQAGAAKTLFEIDPLATERLTLDNEEGHFEFYVDEASGMWTLDGDDQFSINTYAVAAINNYFCTLQSEKTVAFDCEDPSVYGFDTPVTLKLYNADTGEDHPYILYVGNNTATYNSFYAMVDGSNDVYTIDQTSGSIFCVAKNTLKNPYLFDTYSSMMSEYKVEKDGKTIVELALNEDSNWYIKQPQGLTVSMSKISSLMDDIVRVELDYFVEDNPTDLAKYGLDHPSYKLWLGAKDGSNSMKEEIWFGSAISNYENETSIYGYFTSSKEVFAITRSTVSFLEYSLMDYTTPYCADVSITDLQSIEIDLGDVYDLHEKISLDYDNAQYKLGEVDISAMNNENVQSAFNEFYYSITNLRVTDVDVDSEPDSELQPAMKIVYVFEDGSKTTLTFVEKEKNLYYMLKDNVYQNVVVRLNNFTGTGAITYNYEMLKKALQ